MVDVLEDFYLQQLVTEPTRFTFNSSSVLDLLCSCHPSVIASIEIGCEFSDHCAVLFGINVKYQHSQENLRKIYLYQRGDYDRMRADIHQFSSTFSANNPDRFSVEDIWQQIKQTILKAVADITTLWELSGHIHRGLQPKSADISGAMIDWRLLQRRTA